MEALEQEIKELIISSLSLDDVSVADIDSNKPLFVEGMGLDSIDALELGLALQKRYGVVMSGGKDEIQARFSSVASLASFVASQRAAQAGA